MGKQWKEWETYEIKRWLLLGRKAMTNLDSILKSRHYFADKGPYSQNDDFSNSHLWMWELDYKESWVQNNWCFWTVVLKKTLESLLQHHSSKASILWRSAVFIAQLSHLYMTTGKTIALTRQTFVGSGERGFCEESLLPGHWAWWQWETRKT